MSDPESPPQDPDAESKLTPSQGSKPVDHDAPTTAGLSQPDLPAGDEERWCSAAEPIEEASVGG